MGIFLKPHNAINLFSTQEIERVTGIVNDIVKTKNSNEEKLLVLEKEYQDAFREISDPNLRQKVIDLIEKQIRVIKRKITIEKKKIKNNGTE